MSALTVSPLYTSFDNEGCVFLGTAPSMGHLFDLYASVIVKEGIVELLAVPADHEHRGPIAMDSGLCAQYNETHPLYTAHLLATAKSII